ncbi:MAG: pilus assembly protein PilG [Gammaproteobacteria bacterium]|nr:pilus assembly protein PilG [Gammaproteobacteria bacterium]MAY03052.1 pilus assembly protein PilG [Gammaproteobacteria bacterium]|tara:strand:- start:4377 stop:4787 length:411 start_codon:yes stop_codon:yes gene_type:complete
MEQTLQDMKILVIDDSNTIRRTAESLLNKLGCKVITAEDGYDALSKVVASKPDIIFMDVMMPKLNGYETCSIIRSNEEFNDIPVVMLSSKSSFCDKAKGVVVGANSYLTKPFSKDEILEQIKINMNTVKDESAPLH